MRYTSVCAREKLFLQQTRKTKTRSIFFSTRNVYHSKENKTHVHVESTFTHGKSNIFIRRKMLRFYNK